MLMLQRPVEFLNEKVLPLNAFISIYAYLGMFSSLRFCYLMITCPRRQVH